MNAEQLLETLTERWSIKIYRTGNQYEVQVYGKTTDNYIGTYYGTGLLNALIITMQYTNRK